jgi:hypothetical protein
MQPASDFVQQVPREGALATERTETWVMFDNTYELLSRPFTVSPGVTIPIGSYPFSDVTTSYGVGQQRRVSGTVSLQRGRFYNGDLAAVGYSGGRVAIPKQWSVEPSLSINHVELPAGTSTTTVIRTRTDYGFSPPDVCQRAGPVQFNRRSVQQQFPLPVRVPPGERILRGVHRRTRHPRTRVSGPEEPRIRRENQPPVALLALASYHC